MSAPPPTRRSFIKDLQQLCRTIDKSTDGQAAVEEFDDICVRVSLCPKTGYNAHATFFITMTSTPEYPTKPPDVTFETPIFHPNISYEDGHICMALSKSWNACLGLLYVVEEILYLIEHPSFEDAYNVSIGADGEAKVATKTARLLAGLTVDGRRYAPNTSWCEWACANNCLPTEEEEDYAYVWAAPETPTKAEAPLDDKSAEEEEINESLSEVTSETLSSVALTPYSPGAVDDDDGGDLATQPMYYKNFPEFGLAMHRILLLQPTYGESTELKTIFYYGEVLCYWDHTWELGQSYRNLFKGSLIHDGQIDCKFRQTCRKCDWIDSWENPFSFFGSEKSVLGEVHLDWLFEEPPEPPKNLTADFCPWSLLDHRGIYDLFSSLFFEKERPGEDFTCFIDSDRDDDDGVAGFFDTVDTPTIGRLGNEIFDFDSMEASDEKTRPFESTSADLNDEIVGNDRLETRVSPRLSLVDSEASRNGEFQNETSSTLENNRVDDWEEGQMKLCYRCNENRNHITSSINEGFQAVWSWVFRQTRWPIRFAPQQTIELNTGGVYIPAWRVSAGRLLHDVCRFCANNSGVKNLVLLDPMSLSPLSPVLNLMQQDTVPSHRLTGILWMTPLQALSTNYRVPIPRVPSTTVISTNEDSAKVGYYPSPTSLRFLALDAYFTNWVSWMSRIEVYTCLGMSRFQPLFVTDSVASRVLQPFSLVCGQAPVLDLWPLWIFRQLLKLSLYLPQFANSLYFRSSVNEGQGNFDTLFLFPFSDIDEI
ncbi:hypothetical protein Aperf_G00000016586 [Anoplocephala perfoliata]